MIENKSWKCHPEYEPSNEDMDKVFDLAKEIGFMKVARSLLHISAVTVHRYDNEDAKEVAAMFREKLKEAFVETYGASARLIEFRKKLEKKLARKRTSKKKSSNAKRMDRIASKRS